MAEAVRGWRELVEDDKNMAKVMFVTSQYTLAQISRIMRIEYNSLRQVSSREKWNEEREQFSIELSSASATAMQGLTEGFKLRCFRLFERMLSNYDEIMDRHEVHDSFQNFPFDSFWKVLGQMVEFMRAVGALQVSQTQVNLNMQNNIDQRTQNLLAVNGDKAKEALQAVLSEFVRNRRPPTPVDVSGTGNNPQPATGQFR